MLKTRIAGLALVALCAACGGDDTLGAEAAILRLAVGGLISDGVELELPPGPTTVRATATAADATIAISAEVLQNNKIVATVPLDAPNSNPKIPAGLTASAYQEVVLVAGQAANVTLTLKFIPNGTYVAGSLNIAFDLVLDAPAPTINYVRTSPEQLFASQGFTLEVAATNNAGAFAELTASVKILDSANKNVGEGGLDPVNGLFRRNLSGLPSGSYTLKISVRDARGATTTYNKALMVR